jgi:Plant transposon protein
MAFDGLQNNYFQQMNQSDAYRVTGMHKENLGVNGMLSSIDCMHVAWRNCPMAWHGQFKGEEKSPSIVLEAFSDHQLWIWHESFCYAGTLYNISIWERSPLLPSFLDRTFSEFVDFEFDIGGTCGYWRMVFIQKLVDL